MKCFTGTNDRVFDINIPLMNLQMFNDDDDEPNTEKLDALTGETSGGSSQSDR